MHSSLCATSHYGIISTRRHEAHSVSVQILHNRKMTLYNTQDNTPLQSNFPQSISYQWGDVLLPIGMPVVSLDIFRRHLSRAAVFVVCGPLVGEDIYGLGN